MGSATTYPISEHALERFQMRVRPALEVDAARVELQRLIELAEFASEPPAWHAVRTRREADGYLLVGDLLMPLRYLASSGSWLILTCIARGGISDRARGGRNEVRRSRGRQAKRRRLRQGARMRRAEGAAFAAGGSAAAPSR